MSTVDDRVKAERRAQGRRLKAARERLNITTAKAGAAFLKTSEVTYQHHENGNRGMGRAVQGYAKGYDVPEEWILRGKNPPSWAVGDQDLTADDGPHVEHFLGAWREHRKISVEELADQMKLSPEIIRGLEAGEIDLSAKWLRLSAKILRTTPGAIIDADPSIVPKDVIDIWLDSTVKQQSTRERLASLRKTGTH